MSGGATKWILCILLFLATTLNYLDRQTMAILAPTVQHELRLDNEDLGWLFSVFYYTYTFSQFGVGALLDRWNLRWAYGSAVVAWSAAAALTGLANGFLGLLFFRMLLGVMESANWPAAMRIVARALPPRERALGNGIFTSGTSVGALIAPILILGIAGWADWRWAFVAVGSLGLAWFLVWVPFTHRREFTPIWREASGAAHPGWGAYGSILRDPQFWRVLAVTVLVNPCLYFNVNWLPTYFVQERGLGAGQLRWILTAIYLGLDLGYLASGTGVLLLVRRGVALRRARRTVFVAASVLLALSAAVPFLHSLSAAVWTLVVVNFGVGVWIAMYLTMAQEVSPAHVSTAAGLLGGSGSLVGALAMWAVGRVTRQRASFLIPMVSVAVASLLAAVAGWAVSRRDPRGPVQES